MHTHINIYVHTLIPHGRVYYGRKRSYVVDGADGNSLLYRQKGVLATAGPWFQDKVGKE